MNFRLKKSWFEFGYGFVQYRFSADTDNSILMIIKDLWSATVYDELQSHQSGILSIHVTKNVNVPTMPLFECQLKRCSN